MRCVCKFKKAFFEFLFLEQIDWIFCESYVNLWKIYKSEYMIRISRKRILQNWKSQTNIDGWEEENKKR
jgi:hypothetical protein